ncbi:hypothetical protein SESBI_10642 [Sesbania bispinosa]|nr:hypothetical protein SESBI_10642 [Sesbania bispinosa]
MGKWCTQDCSICKEGSVSGTFLAIIILTLTVMLEKITTQNFAVSECTIADDKKTWSKSYIGEGSEEE